MIIRPMTTSSSVRGAAGPKRYATIPSRISPTITQAINRVVCVTVIMPPMLHCWHFRGDRIRPPDYSTHPHRCRARAPTSPPCGSCDHPHRTDRAFLPPPDRSCTTGRGRALLFDPAAWTAKPHQRPVLAGAMVMSGPLGSSPLPGVADPVRCPWCNQASREGVGLGGSTSLIMYAPSPYLACTQRSVPPA
jgi:hypothetical protein